MHSDLISKKTLIKKMKWLCRGNCRTCIYVTFLSNNVHCGLIDDVPTVDAVEVVHGEWIVQNSAYTRFKCSVCGSENHEYRWEYCCKCGAKMDGDLDG